MLMVRRNIHKAHLYTRRLPFLTSFRLFSLRLPSLRFLCRLEISTGINSRTVERLPIILAPDPGA